MTAAARDALKTREAILMLLSDAETARVSNAESLKSLANGDEFVDLEDLGRGVQFVSGSVTPAIGHIVLKSAVEAATWTKIVAQLS